MATIFFNTHDYVKRLTKAGISYSHAGAHADALSISVNREIVTRADLGESVAELKQDTCNLRTELKDEIHSLRIDMNEKFAAVDVKFTEIKGQFDLLKWMVGLTLAGMIALVSKLFL